MDTRELLDSDSNSPRLAVLIDADNASPAVIDGLLAELARFGVASVRRIYGDWTSPRHAGWKKVLLEHSLAPVQQFAYTTGKNATDSAMIIDAMDLMYTRRFAGFCLVSSDSDFTRLAQRLREEGLTVYGVGERKTPSPFVAACDRFIYAELLRGDNPGDTTTTTESTNKPAATPSVPGTVGTTAPTETGKTQATPLSVPFDLINRAIGESDDDDGWAHLGAVGSYLTKVRPDFDARLYGFKKLSDLFRAHHKRFELRETTSPGSSTKLMHVRLARTAGPQKPAKKTAAKPPAKNSGPAKA